MAYFTNHKVYIPKFTTTEVAGVTFGGFEVCKYPCSQPNATAAEGSPDVAHSGVAGSVPGISRAGLPVWDYVIFPQAMIACCNMGKGYHLTSAFERASLAFLAQKTGTMPHGGNKNVNPPTDITYTNEIGVLDKHLYVESSGSYMRALPGTGPNTWAHNHMGSGVFDLNGLVWEWMLMMMSTDGYARVPANLDVTYTGSPYGRGTITGSGTATPTLTCDGSTVNWLKQWTADEFNGLDIYIAEAGGGAGVLYPAIADTTANTIILANGSAPGNGTATFSVFRTVATDITTGMTSGNRILTLRNSDADLKAFGIPLTSDGTGSPVYGNDGFWYDKAAERAAIWGGNFISELGAGVFALGLNYAPSVSSYHFGFRACKAL
jgi:hypothetical protein